jgi:hypothetical protein
MIVDWFEKLTGFRESNYQETRDRLEVEGSELRSLINGASYSIGELDLVSLLDLRERGRSGGTVRGRLKTGVVTGDIRHLHRLPGNAGAVFQVASQFNLLEMMGPEVTPERGVGIYQNDHTQGPACAIAAGAATIYRNYFVPINGHFGQRTHRQLNGLADVGCALSQATNRPVTDLWTMQNGYALGTQDGLRAIRRYLEAATPGQVDVIRGKLRVGVHSDVEVTEIDGPTRPTVTQAFCSALPLAYSNVSPDDWKPFALLVLEAAYEATMWASVINAQRRKSNIVILTELGGGAFGNPKNWIHSAIRRSLLLMSDFDLDVRFVSRREPSRELLEVIGEFE